MTQIYIFETTVLHIFKSCSCVFLTFYVLKALYVDDLVYMCESIQYAPMCGNAGYSLGKYTVCIDRKYLVKSNGRYVLTNTDTVQCTYMYIYILYVFLAHPRIIFSVWTVSSP